MSLFQQQTPKLHNISVNKIISKKIKKKVVNFINNYLKHDGWFNSLIIFYNNRF